MNRKQSITDLLDVEQVAYHPPSNWYNYFLELAFNRPDYSISTPSCEENSPRSVTELHHFMVLALQNIEVCPAIMVA